MKDHIDLPVLHRRKRGLQRIEADGLEMDGLVETVRRVQDVVIEHARHLPGLRILHAEARIVSQIADADAAMLRKPVLLFRGQRRARLCRDIALVELVRIERIIPLHRAHRHVQLLLQIRAALRDAEVNIRAARVYDRRQSCICPDGGLRRQHAVQLPRCKQRLRFVNAVDRHVDGRDVMLLFPRTELRVLNGFLHHRDALSLETRKLRRRNVGMLQIHVQIVALLPHRLLREKHMLCTLVGIGNGTHDLDLPVLKLLKQRRPVILHIDVIPAGVGCHRLLVLVAVATATAIRIRDVVGILVPGCTDIHIHIGGTR